MDTNMIPTDPSSIGFPDLSPELRNRIYDFALVLPDPILFDHKYSGRLGARFLFMRDQKGALSLPLLRTCRQIYDEASTIFYGDNTFRFLDPLGFSIFALSLTPDKIVSLRYIEIIDYDHLSHVVRNLHQVKNLEMLRLRIPWNMVQDFESRDALEVALELKPLADEIYRNQKVKDKQKILATFCFGDCEQYWIDDPLPETEQTMKIETAVGGHIYDMLYGETMFVELNIRPRKLKAFWQVQELMKKYPGIRRAVTTGLVPGSANDFNASDAKDGHEGDDDIVHGPALGEAVEAAIYKLYGGR